MRRLLSSCVKRLASVQGALLRFLPPTRDRMIRLTPNGRDTFFGYYDKTPFSGDGTRVLGHNLCPGQGDSVDVGLFHLEDDNRFQVLGRTGTWSWQLGARLQWMPGREDDLVGYNTLVGGRHGFVVQNVATGAVEAQYAVPVFDVSPDGRYALGLNFARLRRMRAGYGYGGMADPSEGRLCPDDDGVILIDLQSGSHKLIFSLTQLCALDPRESMEGAEHYLNHLAFSPSGERFFFLHLWNRGAERFSRPITAGRDGGNLFVLENVQNMSHYAWKTERELLIHTSKGRAGTRYLLFTDRTPNRRVIGEGVLSLPGHPSYAPDRRRLVVDTYPDRTRRQHLLLCTGEGQLVREIGRFYSPPAFSGARKCDLHPRWDRTGSRVCIDSVHEGRRAIYLISV